MIFMSSTNVILSMCHIGLEYPVNSSADIGHSLRVTLFGAKKAAHRLVAKPCFESALSPNWESFSKPSDRPARAKLYAG